MIADSPSLAAAAAAQALLGLSGRTILVTGASGTIGGAVARRLAGLGARLALSGRRDAAMAEFLGTLPGAGHAVIAADLTDRDLAASLVERAAEGLGAPLTGIAHCAGEHVLRPARYLTDGDITGATALTSAAALALARGLAGQECEGRSLVLISSVAAHAGAGGLAAYGAGFAGMEAASRALAVELAGAHIRVNCVASGHLEGPLDAKLRKLLPEPAYAALRARHLLGIGRAEQVASAMIFLLSDAAAWITGTTLVVDGGYLAQ